MYKTILVPLDGSGLAEAAVSHASRLALQFSAKIILLRVVVSPYAIVAPDLVLAGYDADLQAQSAEAEQYLRDVAGRLRQDSIAVDTITCEGPVAEAIVDHAAALDVDLIVMSTHGRGGVSRWVYGSVADRVLQAAACPILLLRAPNNS